eukprot:TRINITY_DN14989_c0_g1_i1.p2 TRINITY_DN14989_c0_g1~~TRINITY_DN14989_c0_g1_i1.p2  ORF type:complete len:202 (+),score=27.03 TRINITY_DN14989_c0_g1_i1:55-660(+)
MKPLSDLDHLVIAVSMPGYGHSDGDSWAFRREGVPLLREVIKAIKKDLAPANPKIILVGRSVGGKNVLAFAAEEGCNEATKIAAVIATHPVVPPTSILQKVSQPVLLTWAKDDGLYWNYCHKKDATRKKGNTLCTAGHPYFGTHGARYVLKYVPNCELLSWNEKDYFKFGDALDSFYSSTFSQKAQDFFVKHGLTKKSKAT